jgi:hypothetical protein
MSADLAYFLTRFQRFCTTAEGARWRARWYIVGAPVALDENRWRVRSRTAAGDPWLSVFDERATLISTLPEEP